MTPDELLAPGERVVWSDRARPRPLRALGLPPRSPGELGRVALLGLAGAVGLGAVATTVGPALAGALALAIALAIGGAQAIARAGAARYALTDRGRGMVLSRREAFVFDLPDASGLRADPDLETGDLDLGERAGTAQPGGRAERRRVVLRDVAYPTIARTIAMDLARQAAERPPAGGGPSRPDAG